uniref:Uncharacterized protein n=1 Tax=Xenopus tropicalis TaxID=8364 RepID=A0A803JUP3_XENTR
ASNVRQHLCNEERLAKLGLFTLGKRCLRGDIITMYKYIRGSYNNLSNALFTSRSFQLTQRHQLCLEERRFRLNIRKGFFTVRAVRLWNSLPKSYSYIGLKKDQSPSSSTHPSKSIHKNKQRATFRDPPDPFSSLRKGPEGPETLLFACFYVLGQIKYNFFTIYIFSVLLDFFAVGY